jgi:hypothetical protein
MYKLIIQQRLSVQVLEEEVKIRYLKIIQLKVISI